MSKKNVNFEKISRVSRIFKTFICKIVVLVGGMKMVKSVRWFCEMKAVLVTISLGALSLVTYTAKAPTSTPGHLSLELLYQSHHANKRKLHQQYLNFRAPDNMVAELSNRTKWYLNFQTEQHDAELSV